MKFLIIALMMTSSVWSATRESLPKMLLEVFGGQCKSVGSFSQAALTKTKSLIGIYKNLMTDPECAQVNGVLNSLNIFQDQVQDYQDSKTDFSILKLEREIEELTMALNTVDDEKLIPSITSRLTMNRLQLISTKASFYAENDFSRHNRRGIGYYHSLEALRNVLSQVPNYNRCYNKYPAQMVQILGNAMAAGSYFSNPAMGMGMSGISHILTMATDKISEYVQGRRINNLHDITLPTALSCSAEVITDLYCETLRAERLIRKYANYEEDNIKVWRGIPLIFRELSPLLDWLELVRAGSPASDSFDAQRRLTIMKQRAFLDDLRIQIDGIISETNRELENIDTDVSNYIATKVDRLANMLKSAPSIITLNGNDFLPFRLIGMKEVPKCSFAGRIDPCNGINQFKLFYFNGTSTSGYTFSLSDWSKSIRNSKIIHREGMEFVNRQLSRIINEDQELVLTRAYEGHNGSLPPKEVIQNIHDYVNGVKEYLIEKNDSNGKYNAYLMSIERSQFLMAGILDLLKLWPPDSAIIDGVDVIEEKAGEILSKIYSKLKLNTGSQFLLERLKSIVRWDIISHMENKEFDDELEELIMLNNNEVISDITAYKLFDLQDMINDISNAKGILKGALNSYFSRFQGYFQRAFQLIRDNRLDPALKAKLCIHLLSSQIFQHGRRWSGRERMAQDVYNSCRGIEYTSVFKNSKLAIKFDDYLSQYREVTEPFDTRACLYNNFMRKVRIREIFKDQRRNYE